MRELAAQVRDWREPFVVATVLRNRGNTPRVAGTALAVNGVGEVRGAVSGGCVEADVYRLCQEVLAGAPPAVREFGHLADDLFAIGLDLGGRSPHETPVAIMAEVVAVRHGGTGRPLTDREGPIHQRAAPA